MCLADNSLQPLLGTVCVSQSVPEFHGQQAMLEVFQMSINPLDENWEVEILYSFQKNEQHKTSTQSNFGPPF